MHGYGLRASPADPAEATESLFAEILNRLLQQNRPKADIQTSKQKTACEFQLRDTDHSGI
jgi:hypothetical protein